MKKFLLLFTLVSLVSFYGCDKDDDPVIRGCTNPSAENYNPDATEDDGHCVILGCTNPDASNYNPEATADNGSCIVGGCTNPSAENYDPDATEDDGSCIILGCTDEEALNYNPEATENEGCEYRKDLFLGAYVGSINCDEELLNEFFGEEGFEFVIKELPGENDTVIIEFNLGPVDGEPAKAAIDENHTLRSENTIDGIEIDVTMDGNPENVRITTIVELRRVDGSKDLEGTLTIQVEVEFFGVFAPLLTDECDLTAIWVE